MRNTQLTPAAVQFYRYACAESSAGRLLVVMTDDGVADVIAGDSRKELLSKALARHPGAGMVPDRGVHAHWVAAIVKRVERPGSDWAVPFDFGLGYARPAAG